jgi:predicted ATP-dependent serine protease
MLWRCVACGAFYEKHLLVCTFCWRDGQIAPCSRRQGANIDLVPAISNARSLARMGWNRLKHPGVYEALVIGAGALLLVSGFPGAGKSSWACILLDAIIGAVLLVAAEEGLGPSLAARLARCGIKRPDFGIIARASVDAVVEYALANKVVAIVIDSVQEASWSAQDLRHLLAVVPTLDLVIGVQQVTKEGAPAGLMALQHEADVQVTVEDMRWSLKKSRYQDLADVGGEVLPARDLDLSAVEREVPHVLAPVRVLPDGE